MSITKPATARPPTKKGSKPAPVPKQLQKPFKSAELVEDSDDEDEVTEHSTIKANDVSRQKPLREVWRANAKIEKANKQTSVPAKVAKKLKSKSSSPNTSGTESSDARSHTGERSPDRKGIKETALSGSSQKGTVARPETKLSTTHPRKAGSDGYDSNATEPESSESEEPKTFKQKLAQTKSQPESRSVGEVSSKPAKSAQKSVHEKDSETSEEGASGFETEKNSGSEASSESDGEEVSRSEESDHSTSQMRSEPPSQVAIEPRLLPYAPPAGFEAATISVGANYNLAELFSPSFLQRKQVWHIIAPASVPISSITEVRKQSVTDGSAVMSYKGAEYSLIEENQNLHESVLLPFVEANSYKPSIIGVARTLRLQQIIHPGSKGSLSNIADTERTPYRKPVPKQPEGLKMRYKPFGASESEDSQSESLPDGTNQAPQFRVPQGVRTGSPVKKRKRDELDVGTTRNRDQIPKKARKSDLPTTSTVDRLESSSVKDKPKKHKSSHKDNDVRNKDRQSSTTGHRARLDHDREVVLTEASPPKPHTEYSKKQIEARPLVNGDRVSPTNDIPESVSLKHKSKSKRKRHDNQSAPELTNQSPDKHSSPPTARTDHDRDATAGAQRSRKEVNRDIISVKETSSHKKSKHRDETQEEKAKRRAEKRRRKEMKAKKLKDG